MRRELREVLKKCAEKPFVNSSAWSCVFPLQTRLGNHVNAECILQVRNRSTFLCSEETQHTYSQHRSLCICFLNVYTYYFFFQLHLGDNTLDIAAKASTLRLTMTHSVAPLWLVLKRKDPAGDAERTAPKGAAASVAMRKWSMALQVRFADVFLQMRSNGCASECV